jgi:hypothetical protein
MHYIPLKDTIKIVDPSGKPVTFSDGDENGDLSHALFLKRVTLNAPKWKDLGRAGMKSCDKIEASIDKAVAAGETWFGVEDEDFKHLKANIGYFNEGMPTAWARQYGPYQDAILEEGLDQKKFDAMRAAEKPAPEVTPAS